MMTLEELVQIFRTEHLPKILKEQKRFRKMPSLQKAIEAAAGAIDLTGKREKHQRRIPKASLENAVAILLAHAAELQQAKTFKELHDLVYKLTRHIEKFGELCWYDTAERIGVYRGLEPEAVYMHAGTADGAAACGISRDRNRAGTYWFPPPLDGFAPSVLETFLCCFKNELVTLQKAGRMPSRKSRQG